MLSSTAFLAAAMQCATSIHPDTVFDVAKVESSFNPFAIAEIISKNERTAGSPHIISYMPASRLKAMDIVRRAADKGRHYSVGLMQITSTNFKRYGVTARELLDPCINLSVFERILTDCYRRGGSLKRALSCYYSGNFNTGQRPEAAFKQTSYLQRIGYVVPSTHENSQRKTEAKFGFDIHYPHTLLRGEIHVQSIPKQTSQHYPNAIILGDLPIADINEEK